MKRAIRCCMFFTILAVAAMIIGFACADVEINSANFPDAGFRNRVTEAYDSDGNGSLSDAEIRRVTQIYCEYDHVASLKGIEYFKELIYLECEGNELTSLDLSKNTKLQTVYCFDNKLASLDVGGNTNLDFLCCYGNSLTSLDVSGCTGLKALECQDNRLRSLDVSKCTKLADLVRQYTRETEIGRSEYSCGQTWLTTDSNVTVRAGSFISRPNAQKAVCTVKGGEYQVTGSNAVLAGVKSKNIQALSIPDTIKVDGMKYKVTEIAAGACRNMKKLKKVTIGKNVSKIGANAFSGCKKLKNIIIRTTKLTNGKVGSSAFKTGCGSCRVKCPKNKVSAYKKILTKKGLSRKTKFTK